MSELPTRSGQVPLRSREQRKMPGSPRKERGESPQTGAKPGATKSSGGRRTPVAKAASSRRTPKALATVPDRIGALHFVQGKQVPRRGSGAGTMYRAPTKDCGKKRTAPFGAGVEWGPLWRSNPKRDYRRRRIGTRRLRRKKHSTLWKKRPWSLSPQVTRPPGIQAVQGSHCRNKRSGLFCAPGEM
jgi:hypothetical protein